MLDPVTLDQLRTFITVVEEGSFSAAARKLQRVQSAVSTAMANLEAHLGVSIWDRSTKVAGLTVQGHAMLAAARRVCIEVDALRRLSSDLVQGVEASVSLCVDQLLPVSALVDLCVEFAKEFPAVDLRVDTQTMSDVAARVVAGAATLGVATPLAFAPNLERKVLMPVRMIAVVSAQHPLATLRGPISTPRLEDCVQVVLSERGQTGTPDQAVLSMRTWRVADLHTKHALLRAGLGWGNLPEHLVRDDLARGRLKRIRPQAWGEDEHTLYLSAIYKRESAFGPAHRWLLARLEQLCQRDAAPKRAVNTRARKSKARR